MTTEEKARAYDEALTTAKRIISKNCSELEKLCLECIFPQLKESEDERIRKALVKTFEKKLEIGFEWTEFGIPNRSVLAWLEKQKDLDKMIVVSPEVWDKAISDAFENGKKEGEKQKEQKPVKYGDDVVEEAEEYTSKADCGEYGTEVTEAYIAGVLAERDRKPAGWDEFDEDCLKRAVWYIENPAPSVVKDTNLALWLKSLPERFSLQPKQEWSEEDERIRKAILGFVNPDKGGTKYSSNAELVEWSNWLKSLRPSWKPSEEQLDAAQYVSQFDYGGHKAALESLYEQLKKL